MNVDSKVISAFADIDEVVIDQINILRATHRAMAQASSNLSIEPSFVIIDGMPIKDFPFNNESIMYTPKIKKTKKYRLNCFLHDLIIFLNDTIKGEKIKYIYGYF